MTLAVRVIPCLDIAGGRVVKGVSFEQLRDAVIRWRPPSATSTRAPTRSRFSTSRRPRVPGYAPRARPARRKRPLDPVHGRRRRPHGEDADALLRRRRPGDRQHGRGRRPRAPLAPRGPVRRAVRRSRARRKARPGAGRPDADDGDDARRAEGDGADRRVLGRRGRGGGARARSSSPRWTPTARRKASTSRLLRAVRGVVDVPVVASGGAGDLDDFARAVLIGGADAVLAASVFHDRVFSIVEVKAAMKRAGLACAPSLRARRRCSPGTTRTGSCPSSCATSETGDVSPSPGRTPRRSRRPARPGSPTSTAARARRSGRRAKRPATSRTWRQSRSTATGTPFCTT